MFVMESMMQRDKLERVRNRCGFFDGVCIDSNGQSGGIGLWWRDLEVTLLSYSSRHIVKHGLRVGSTDGRIVQTSIGLRSSLRR